MDIHPPTGKIESVKNYLVHLSMVVFGILIALGLDGWRESHREHALVEHSIAAMRVEIAANRDEVRRSLDSSDNVRQTLSKVIAFIDSAIQKAKANPKAAQSSNFPYQVEFSTPILSAGAWQAAVATQALAHMDYKQAQVWSSLYADQDDLRPFQNELTSEVERFVVMGSPSDVADVTRLAQRRDLARELSGRLAITQQAWRGLLKRYEQVLSATQDN